MQAGGGHCNFLLSHLRWSSCKSPHYRLNHPQTAANALSSSIILLFLPETLYVRDKASAYAEGSDSIAKRMKPWGIRHPGRRIHAAAFMRPFQMLKYWPIVLVGFYTAVAFTLGSVGPAQTASALFRTFYKWKSARTGLALSLSSTIGGVLGEIIAGPVTVRICALAYSVHTS